MKLLLTFLGCIVLSAFSIKAQSTDSVHKTSGYVSAFGGVGLPLGNYAATTTDASIHGRAKTGSQFGIDGAYPIFNKHFGIAGGYTFFSNQFNFQELPTRSSPALVYLEDDRLSYQGNAMMAGLLATAASYNVSFDVEAKTGFLILNYPGAYVTYWGNTDPTYKYNKGTAYGLLVDIKAQVRFELNKLGILFYGNYFYANPNGTLVSINSFGDVLASTRHNIPVELFSFGAALFYQLGK